MYFFCFFFLISLSLSLLLLSQASLFGIRDGGSFLVDTASLPLSSIRGFLLDHAVHHFNLAPLTPGALSDLLAAVLPKGWERGRPSLWRPTGVPSRGLDPPASWFRDLWAYLAPHGNALSLLADGWPLLPTNEGFVFPLGRSYSLIATEGLSPCLRALLSAIEVPTVYDALFDPAPTAINSKGPTLSSEEDCIVSTSSPVSIPVRPSEQFWHFVFPPTRAGLLPALGARQRIAATTRIEGFAEKLGALEPQLKDDLRAFLAREPLDELTDDDAAVAARLPIYRAFSSTGDEAVAADATTAGMDTLCASGEHEGSTAFVPVRNGSGVSRPYLLEQVSWRDQAAAPPLLFLAPCPRPETELLLRIGAVPVTRRAFYEEHVLPRLEGLPPPLRNASALALLDELPRILERSAGGDAFRELLRCLKFVPITYRNGCPGSSSSPLLQAPCKLFDPEVS